MLSLRHITLGRYIFPSVSFVTSLCSLNPVHDLASFFPQSPVMSEPSPLPVFFFCVPTLPAWLCFTSLRPHIPALTPRDFALFPLDLFLWVSVLDWGLTTVPLSMRTCCCISLLCTNSSPLQTPTGNLSSRLRPHNPIPLASSDRFSIKLPLFICSDTLRPHIPCWWFCLSARFHKYREASLCDSLLKTFSWSLSICSLCGRHFISVTNRTVGRAIRHMILNV